MDIFDPEYNAVIQERKKNVVQLQPRGETTKNQSIPPAIASQTSYSALQRGDAITSPSQSSRLEVGRGYTGGTVGADGTVWR
jgi:hypothetical protein